METPRQQAYERARARWSGVVLDYAAFCRMLDTHGFTQSPLPPCADELYLCGACALADPVAVRALETSYFASLRGVVARFEPREEAIAEVLQLLRHKLLTGRSPRIASYSGRGPLAAWLSIAAGRVALDQGRAMRRKHERPIELAEQLMRFEDRPEQTLFVAQHASTLKTALVAVLGSLSARERNVLKLHFAEQLSIDAIGRIYGVHRATVARWVARVRQRVFEQVRTQLKRELRAATESEFESMTRALCEGLEFSLSTLLKVGTGADQLD